MILYLLHSDDMFFFLWIVAKESASSSSEPENNDELEQITIARALLTYRLKEKLAMANPNAPIPFPKKFPVQNPRPTSPQPPPFTTSKILPLICQKTASRSRPQLNAVNDSPLSEGRAIRPLKFPAAGAAPYVPIRQFRTPCHGIAPPVTIRTAVPVFSAPPRPSPPAVPCQVMCAPSVRIAPPVTIRQAIPVYASPPVQKEDAPAITKEDPAAVAPAVQNKLPAQREDAGRTTVNNPQEVEKVQSLEQLKI